MDIIFMFNLSFYFTFKNYGLCIYIFFVTEVKFTYNKVHVFKIVQLDQFWQLYKLL